ncbi:MAG: GNAT family N-acetyltransferase [Planctomycetota bacterium]
MSIRIERAHLETVPQVAKLFDDYRVWYGKESDIDGAVSFLSERVQQQESVVFVAYEDSPDKSEPSAIGFTQCYPLFSSTRMRPMWLLNDLFVDPKFRGRGVSKQLIESAKELTRTTDACGILLETETTNDIGNRLYPAVGFELEKNNFYFWTRD